MARITKAQKIIFLNHKESWSKGLFDEDKLPPLPSLAEGLRSGKTYRQLWNYCYGAMTLTSQLMASDHTLGVLSNAGELAVRNRFKFILNKLNIK